MAGKDDQEKKKKETDKFPDYAKYMGLYGAGGATAGALAAYLAEGWNPRFLALGGGAGGLGGLTLGAIMAGARADRKPDNSDYNNQGAGLTDYLKNHKMEAVYSTAGGAAAGAGVGWGLQSRLAKKEKGLMATMEKLRKSRVGHRRGGAAYKRIGAEIKKAEEELKIVKRDIKGRRSRYAWPIGLLALTGLISDYSGRSLFNSWDMDKKREQVASAINKGK